MFTALRPATLLRTPTLLLLIATIAFVPPLVRAAARLTDPSTASPIRLNRGFESPPSKCTVVPPVDARGESVPQAPQPVRVERFEASGHDEPLPDSAPSRSRDPLRGPPFPSLS